MGFLSKVTSGAKHIDLRPKSGLVGHVVDAAENLGSAYLGGYLNAKMGENAKWRGQELTYLAGLGGQVLAAAMDIFGLPGASLAPHLNSVSMGLLSAHVAAVGAQHGLDARSGGGALAAGKRKVQGILGNRGATVLGAIPPAAPGKFLDFDQVGRLAAMRG